MRRPSEHPFAARRRWLRAAASFPFAAAACPAAAATASIRRVDFTASDGVRLSLLTNASTAASTDASSDAPTGTRTGGRGQAALTIVFIPGWSMPAEIFRAQLEALGRQHRVVAFDPRGQGESDAPRDGYTLERRTADLAELVSRHERVVLVGWSLGVLEVLEYIARHGESRLAAVVLVDNSVGEPPAPRGGDFIARLRADRARTLAGFVRTMFNSPQPEERVTGLARQALKMPLEGSIALLSYPRPREHWRDVTRAITVPLAYVVTPRFAGQADSLRRHRPATRVEVFERAGHALFVDEPDRFNELVHELVVSTAPR